MTTKNANITDIIYHLTVKKGYKRINQCVAVVTTIQSALALIFILIGSSLSSDKIVSSAMHSTAWLASTTGQDSVNRNVYSIQNLTGKSIFPGEIPLFITCDSSIGFQKYIRVEYFNSGKSKCYKYFLKEVFLPDQNIISDRTEETVKIIGGSVEIKDISIYIKISSIVLWISIIITPLVLSFLAVTIFAFVPIIIWDKTFP